MKYSFGFSAAARWIDRSDRFTGPNEAKQRRRSISFVLDVPRGRKKGEKRWKNSETFEAKQKGATLSSLNGTKFRSNRFRLIVVLPIFVFSKLTSWGSFLRCNNNNNRHLYNELLKSRVKHVEMSLLHAAWICIRFRKFLAWILISKRRRCKNLFSRFFDAFWRRNVKMTLFLTLFQRAAKRKQSTQTRGEKN